MSRYGGGERRFLRGADGGGEPETQKNGAAHLAPLERKTQRRGKGYARRTNELSRGTRPLNPDAIAPYQFEENAGRSPASLEDT